MTWAKRIPGTWGTPGKASVLVGGQFGSEGKGLAAAYLAERAIRESLDNSSRFIATTNAGAQAGHTTKYENGDSFVCFHLPTSAVVMRRHGLDCLTYINGGSIIDPHSLFEECRVCLVPLDEVIIHPRAAIIQDANVQEERDASSSQAKSGSTQKGVGSTLADKVRRRAKLAKDDPLLAMQTSVVDLNTEMVQGRASVLVEVPQGTDLSINHGLSYPHVTSRDCWVGSGISDAGIHPTLVQDVCMVIRTLPIRVGHIYDEGYILGHSGPFWSDGRELEWATDLPGVEPERTTVTKRVRRIAEFSLKQYRASLALNRPTLVFVNFMNYLETKEQAEVFLSRLADVEQSEGLFPSHIFGFGPNVEDVTENADRAFSWYKNRRF